MRIRRSQRTFHGHRIEETAFTKGQGPDPRTITTVGGGNDDPDPLE
jgi:hypothetical protein